MGKVQHGTISADEHKLVFAYIAANLIYDNGQRPSIVQYMDASEYLERTIVDGHKIIQVVKHKTGINKGLVKIVISNSITVSLLQAYYAKIRQTVKAAN